MTSKERLLQFVDYKGISKRKFYTATGLSNGYLDNVGSIGTAKLEMVLSAYPELNGEWILSGRGEMFQTPETFGSQMLDESQSQKRLPLIPIDAMAGYGGESVQVMHHDIKEWYVVPDFRGADFMIRVKGSSMYPKYNSGDVVACKKLELSDLFFQWNKVYVLDTEQGALIKRVHKGQDSDHVLIVSENERYQPFELHRSKINAVAIVIGVIRLE